MIRDHQKEVMLRYAQRQIINAISLLREHGYKVFTPEDWQGLEMNIRSLNGLHDLEQRPNTRSMVNHYELAKSDILRILDEVE